MKDFSSSWSHTSASIEFLIIGMVLVKMPISAAVMRQGHCMEIALPLAPHGKGICQKAAGALLTVYHNEA